MAETVLEGFICPMCKQDLKASDQLLAHFQDNHSEEQALIRTFKDLLDKAKKKILKPNTSPEHGLASNSSSISTSYEIPDEPQEIGIIVSHTKRFMEIRNEIVQRRAVSTNQLVIRMEKLLENMPSDPLKRKAHEQNTVPWIDGTLVSRCPNCTSVFHLANRQHHCRICGGIMCGSCSCFMPLHTARYILDKAVEESESKHNNVESDLRICSHCIAPLELRKQLKECQTKKPLISEYYEKYSELKKHADEYYELYLKMCHSLNAGESNYKLQDAKVLRVKLLRVADSIDLFSNKIASLGMENPEKPLPSQTLRLQSSVRSAATTFLRSRLQDLPPLPTEQQLLEAQAKRKQEITNRIEEEKRRQARLQSTTTSAQTRPSLSHQRTSSYSDSSVSMGQGWIPEKKKLHKNEDPLIEQMHIIRSYIMEAQAANRLDELASLELNLEELKKEYWKKQDNDRCNDTSRSGDSSEVGSLGSFEDSKTNLDNNHSDFFN